MARADSLVTILRVLHDSLLAANRAMLDHRDDALLRDDIVMTIRALMPELETAHGTFDKYLRDNDLAPMPDALDDAMRASDDIAESLVQPRAVSQHHSRILEDDYEDRAYDTPNSHRAASTDESSAGESDGAVAPSPPRKRRAQRKCAKATRARIAVMVGRDAAPSSESSQSSASSSSSESDGESVAARSDDDDADCVITHVRKHARDDADNAANEADDDADDETDEARDDADDADDADTDDEPAPKRRRTGVDMGTDADKQIFIAFGWRAGHDVVTRRAALDLLMLIDGGEYAWRGLNFIRNGHASDANRMCFENASADYHYVRDRIDTALAALSPSRLARVRAVMREAYARAASCRKYGIMLP